MTRVLSLDVGGTNVRLAKATVDARTVSLHEKVYAASREFPTLEAALAAHRAFWADAGIERVSIAVAGPVVDGVGRMTNLGWTIDAQALGRAVGLPVRVMNDFEAMARGVRRVPESAIVTLQEGRPDPAAPVAVLGAGTGLGQALLVPDAAGERVLATEGGHATLAPVDDQDAAFIAFVRRKLGGGHVSVERAVSGRGLASIFEWLVEDGLATPGAALLAEIAAGDAGAAIGAAGTRGSDPAARLAVDRFVRFYGAEAGNLALKCVPRAGLYVTGGIAAKILPRLREGFLPAFLGHGRMHALLASIPVHVVLDGDVGLRGAAAAAA